MHKANEAVIIHNAVFSLPLDCAGLSLVNIVLTNNHLIILTTLGLFISQDLRYPSGRILNVCEFSFTLINFLSHICKV